MSYSTCTESPSIAVMYRYSPVIDNHPWSATPSSACRQNGHNKSMNLIVVISINMYVTQAFEQVVLGGPRVGAKKGMHKTHMNKNLIFTTVLDFKFKRRLIQFQQLSICSKCATKQHACIINFDAFVGLYVYK